MSEATEIVQTECLDIQKRSLGNGVDEITIAANDTAGGVKLNLKEMDTSVYMKNPVVLLDHGLKGHTLPIGRTSKLIRQSKGSLRAQFEFLPDDEMATRVKNAWDKGFIRAASIGWERDPQTNKIYLREWSLVSVPADRDAVRSLAHNALEYIISPPGNENRTGTETDKPNETEVTLEQKDVDKMFADSLKRLGINTEKPNEPQQLTVENVRSIVTETTQGVLAQAKAAQDKADEDRKEKEKLQADMQTKANVRAAIIASALPHIDSTVDVNALSDRDIMVRALGDTVQVTESMNDDYVRGMFDTFIASQRSANTQQGQAQVPQMTPLWGGAQQNNQQGQQQGQGQTLHTPSPTNAGLLMGGQRSGLNGVSHISILDQIKLRNEASK